MNIFTKLVSLLKSETEMVPNSIDDSARIKYGNLHVSKELDNFLRNEVVEGLDIAPDQFWNSFEKILEEFGPRNKNLLDKRKDIQNQIDDWQLWLTLLCANLLNFAEKPYVVLFQIFPKHLHKYNYL